VQRDERRSGKRRKLGPNTDGCALYRHFDAAGALLYVGIALDPIYRLSAHQSYDADVNIFVVDAGERSTAARVMCSTRVAMWSIGVGKHPLVNA
jgi:hypothetical protein